MYVDEYRSPKCRIYVLENWVIRTLGSRAYWNMKIIFLGAGLQIRKVRPSLKINSYNKDKTIVRPSYFHDKNTKINKKAALLMIRLLTDSMPSNYSSQSWF